MGREFKKDILLFVSIFMVLLLISGGTYAYWTWQSTTDKTVVFNTSKGIEEYIEYDAGSSYFVGDFQPSSTYCDGMSNTLSFNLKTTGVSQSELQKLNKGLLVNSIKMDVNSIQTNISKSNAVYWVLTSGEASSCTGNLSDAVAYGTFNGKKSGDVLTLLSEETVTIAKKTYTVWIWIDSSGSNLSSLSGETIDVNIWSQIDMLDNSVIDVSPEISEGMIPVKLSSDGTVTTVSAADSSWYNYNNKEWANAVLVKENGSRSRTYYKNNIGETVNQDDILAYYVWIPRYKYKIWTLSTSTTGSEQTIDIVFESASEPVTLGTNVGEYRTHPAFVWDGHTVAGIWVGKFETTGDATTPTILPNKASLKSQNVSTQFTTSLQFAGGTLSNGTVNFSGSDTYGLTSSTDSHMMKNSEWGAVAYLSHSVYGINDEIRINNSSRYTTGCGAASENGSSTSSCEISYNATSTPQSTTGNITGVFDMSGGAWEYVMGALADSSGNPRSGYNSSNNSGFNGLFSDDTSFTSGISFPPSKYYDLYTSSSSTTACNGGICYGHALSETTNWYSDYANFVNSNIPWFERSGRYNDGADAGSWSSSGIGGDAFGNISWRSVLVG